MGKLEGDCALKANDRLVLQVFLQKLAVEDLGEGTLYPHVLTQDEDHILDMKFVRLSPGARRGFSHGSLKFNMARLHVLAAPHLLQTVQVRHI